MQINTLVQKWHKHFSPDIISSLLFGMLGAAIVLIISHIVSPPTERIGTINITGIVDQFIKEEKSKQIAPEIMQQDVKKFGHQFEISLKHFAKKHHLILLPTEALIAGSDDYTSWFTDKISRDDAHDQ